MIETARPLAAEPDVKLPGPDPAPLLEQLARLRPENAALRAQNAALLVALYSMRSERLFCE